MKLRARHRGINDLHDDFFNRVKGRTVSEATHHDDETSELHYHELTFSKPGEPDAKLPIVPVTALVRPRFMLSRQRVQQLQRLLVDKSTELLQVLDAFELAQLHYCIGSVWSVAWLPLEDGTSLPSFPPLSEYQQVVEGTASGSQSEGAALSGRAQRAVPPEASPEGRKALARFSRLQGLKAIEVELQNDTPFPFDLAARATSELVDGALRVVVHLGPLKAPTEVIERVAATEAPKLTGLEPTAPALYPLHSIDYEIDNRTEFAITADATFLGRLPAAGERYELARAVLTIRHVEPRAGEIWPE